MNVRKEKLKVLLVDSEPRYEFRYLKNYLEREETIALRTSSCSRPTPNTATRTASALPTFPAAKDELFAYDVVLLGDADPGFPQRLADAEPLGIRHREGGRPTLHRRARSTR